MLRAAVLLPMLASALALRLPVVNRRAVGAGAAAAALDACTHGLRPALAEAGAWANLGGPAVAPEGAYAPRSSKRSESLYDKQGGVREDVWAAKLENQLSELEGVVAEELQSGNWAAVDREINSPLLSEVNMTLYKLAGTDKALKAQAAAVKAKFFAFVDECDKKRGQTATAAGVALVTAMKDYAKAVNAM